MAVSSLVPAATGPTLAEITAAITTNAAPASVTNTSIATQVANNATPFGGTWTNLYANTPGTSVGTLTISGLGSYKYIRVGWNGVGCSTAGNNLQIRFNGDAGSNYYGPRGYANSTGPFTNTSSSGPLTFFNFNRCGIDGEANANTGQFDVFGSNSAAYKVLNNQQHMFFDGSAQIGLVRAVNTWYSTAAITSITFFFNAGNFTTGSKFYIDGAN